MKYRIVSFIRCHGLNTMPEMLLLLSWLAGSSLGLWAECFFGDSLVSFLRLLPSTVPEWSSVVVTAMLPLLLSACAVVLLHDIACYCCSLLRSFSQGVVVGAICRLYGYGAPVMVYLFLFSGMWINVILFWFWQRRLCARGSGFVSDCCLSLIGCIAVSIVNRLAIAPFLVEVINLS